MREPRAIVDSLKPAAKDSHIFESNFTANEGYSLSPGVFHLESEGSRHALPTRNHAATQLGVRPFELERVMVGIDTFEPWGRRRQGTGRQSSRGAKWTLAEGIDCLRVVILDGINSDFRPRLKLCIDDHIIHTKFSVPREVT